MGVGKTFKSHKRLRQFYRSFSRSEEACQYAEGSGSATAVTQHRHPKRRAYSSPGAADSCSPSENGSSGVADVVVQLRSENIMLKQEVARMKDLVRLAAGRVEEVERKLVEVINEEDNEQQIIDELMEEVRLSNKETESIRERIGAEAHKLCPSLRVLFGDKEEGEEGELTELEQQLGLKVELQAELKGLVNKRKQQLRQMEETVQALREQREEGGALSLSFQLELVRKEEELRHLRESLTSTEAEVEKVVSENKSLCVEKGMLVSKLEEKGEKLKEALDLATEYKNEVEKLRLMPVTPKRSSDKPWLRPTLAAVGSAIAFGFVSLVRGSFKARRSFDL
ncbi:hypothetical protein CBR_g24041 [Chara braunii]|uniref:Uncharacterized protein n=1 Tax=Chara braunii TaxID=69332 RepID=A0A388L5L1_CHABU|nr:hypothetical protein CBR_g24041 [Chara braunii]|eukprot:GBG77594.1 hypothetical protein CBR_g24041 [Chara braunii]